MEEYLVKDCQNKMVQMKSGDLAGNFGKVTDIATDRLGTRGHAKFTNLKTGHVCFLDLERKDICKILTPQEVKKIYKGMSVTTKLCLSPLAGWAIGADPEVFVVDKNGVVIPAFTFLKSKKQNPDMYWDGFQAEFTTGGHGGQGVGCLMNLTDAVRMSLTNILGEAKNYSKDARLTWRSVIDIPPEIMAKGEEKHIQLGCAPSLNIYPETKSIVIDDPASLPIRFAGCHLHFGTGLINKETVEEGIRGIDAILGIITVSLFRGMEDPRRRVYYGRAGEYRLPKHGIEYRAISSAMLAHPVLWHLCFDIARLSLNIGMSGTLPVIWKARKYDIIDTINTHDIRRAEKILRNNKEALLAMLERRYSSDKSKAKLALGLILDGASKYFDLDNMEKSWLISDQNWYDGKNTYVHRLSIKVGD